MLDADVRARAVRRWFGCCRKTIESLAAGHRLSGDVCDSPRTGRARVTTPRTARDITLTCIRQRRLPATVTARRYGVSGQTIRYFRTKTDQSTRPYIGQVLTGRQRDTRLRWVWC